MPRQSAFGYARNTLTINCPFTGHLDGTGAYNLVLSKTLGYAAELERVEVVTTVVGAGTSASKPMSVRKGNATGTICGSITPNLSNQGTIAVVTAGTVTGTNAANKFLDTDTLSVTFDTGAATAFTAGGFDLLLTFRTRLQLAA
jgi:hypothetical protein